ncbi:MAG: glutathione S-transferase family protein [Gammaproteobacteria bacterium]|nr:glutathione S-transferase family protein [Gammaproteobacteria bacterium]
MPLIFYCGSGSPYAWRVWLALEHKQIPYELKILSFDAGDLRKPEFLKLNPRHRVPVIVDGDFALYESAAILEYLEDKYPATDPQRVLFPANIQQRASVRRLIREIDQYFSAGIERLVEQILFTPKEKWNEAEISAARQICHDELAYFERILGGDFLAGAVSAADFSLYPLLALSLRMQKRKPELAMDSAIGPKLDGWKQRLEALAYFPKTYPPHWK